MRRGATRLASAAKEPPLSVPKRSRGAAVSPSHQGPSVPTEGPIFLNQNSETEEEHPSRRRKGRRASTNCPSFTPPERLCFYLSEPASQLRVCTSGYHYDHWHVPGSFYDGISEKLEFPRYSAEFDCVELNATFYRWFKDAVFEGWRARAAAIRPSFEYVIKAHQFYTHWKRLNVDDKFKESWEKFWRSCQLLGPHLGPVLFQFPENFKLHPSSPKRTKIRKRKNEGPGDEEEKEEEHQGTPPSNLARLEALGEILSPDCRAVFEFRHSSWFSEEVYEVLRRHNWCLALVETSGKGLGEDNGGKIARTPDKNQCRELLKIQIIIIKFKEFVNFNQVQYYSQRMRVELNIN